MGNVVLTNGTKSTIQRYSEDTLTSIVQLDNVGELLHSDVYKEASDHLANYVSHAVMKKKSESFHNSLAWYEKLGFMSSEKQKSYEISMNRAGKTAALTTSIAAASVPYIADAVQAYHNKSNFRNFFIRWVGYINQGAEVTPIMVSNVKSILDAGNVGLSNAEVAAGIRASQSGTSFLPHLTRGNLSALNNVEEENMNTIAKMVVSTADLDQPRIRDRAHEFLTEVFNISYYDAEAKLTDVMYAQEHLSDFLIFSSLDYVTVFRSFIASCEDAVKIGSYDADMDVYARKRKENKQTVINIAKDAVEIGGKIAASAITRNPSAATGCIAPAKDILRLSEGLMSSTLNPDHDPAVGRQIMKTIVEQRKSLKTIECEA